MFKNPKQILVVAIVAATFFVGGVLVAGNVEKPSSVIHVVTVDWNDGATKADIQKALDGVEQLAKDYDGISACGCAASSRRPRTLPSSWSSPVSRR